VNFPKRVQINEVVLRDGLQLEKKIVSINEKKLLLDHLIKAQVKTVEFGSFVQPKLVPQMANTGELYSLLSDGYKDLTLIALIPNLKGTEIAYSHGVKEVNFVFSASDTHNLQNVHKRTAESLKELEEIQAFCLKKNIELSVSIATTFGCPFEGEVPTEKIKSILAKVISFHVKKITLADTTGMANPKQVYDVLISLRSDFPDQKFNLHFHNTRGMGLSNILAGMQAGVDSYDTSLGGLGGCPFAPGATGNVCTEDAVHMLHSMGIETGLYLEELITASETLTQIVEYETPSYIRSAGSYNRKFPIPIFIK